MASNPLAMFLRNPEEISKVTGLTPEFQAGFSSMMAAAPPEIRDQIKIFSGFRDTKKQAQLFSAAVKKYGSYEAARHWVAPPGKSQHGKGNASDLQFGSPAARAWAHENAPKYGMAFPMGHEPWHIETAGARGSKQNQAVQQPQEASAPAEDAGTKFVANLKGDYLGPPPGPAPAGISAVGQAFARTVNEDVPPFGELIPPPPPPENIFPYIGDVPDMMYHPKEATFDDVMSGRIPAGFAGRRQSQVMEDHRRFSEFNPTFSEDYTLAAHQQGGKIMDYTNPNWSYWEDHPEEFARYQATLELRQKLAPQ